MDTTVSGASSVRAGSRGALVAVLALVLAFQALSWGLQRGYPIADIVEYVERARDWVDGVPLGGERTIRSFVFSALFVPLHLVDRWLDVHDPGWVMLAARLCGLAFGLAFVAAVARLGTRLGARLGARPGALLDSSAGATVGLAAAAIAGLNPVFLRYTVWPLADVAAATCLALGLAEFVERGRARRELVGAAWFALSFLCAYKTLPVIAVVGVACLVRDRKRASAWGSIALGTLAAIAIQVVVDRWIYGEWGGSVWRYLVDNIGTGITTFLMRLGLVEAARVVYSAMSDLRGLQMHVLEPETRQLMSKSWYVSHLTEFLSWPALALFALGAFHAWRRRSVGALILAAAIAFHAVSASFKGDKSFRLWLPILPACAVFCGLGFELARESLGRRGRLAALALVACVGALSPFELERRDPHRNGSFWDAIEFANGIAREHPTATGRALTVGSSFFWGPYARNSPEVELVRLWPPFDRFGELGPGVKRALLEKLDALDGLIVHVAVLEGRAELAREIDARFGLVAAFHDSLSGVAPGPVVLLARQHGDPAAKRCFASERVADLAAYRAAHDFGAGVRFVARVGDVDRELELLGVEHETPPGAGTERLVWHWRLAGGSRAVWRVRARVAGATSEFDVRALDLATAPGAGADSVGDRDGPAELVLREARVVPADALRRPGDGAAGDGAAGDGAAGDARGIASALEISVELVGASGEPVRAAASDATSDESSFAHVELAPAAR
jgi:hypothetical protein